MYQEFFGLREAPFTIAPDPRYLYLSVDHREALAHLLYGLRGDGGFVLLTGEVGTGKTTICRCLLEQIPEQVQVALVLNPKLTVSELLATICDDLGVSYPPGNLSHKVFIDNLNQFLLASNARGRSTVLIVDEAQNLSGEVLEELRLLTNLETNTRKLLQIILIGQPELRVLLARPELRQVAQRITARYHLGPLGRRDLSSYLQHRLAVAGARQGLFSPAAIVLLHRFSRGIPRLINVLCDRALLGAYTRGRHQVDAGLVKAAAREVLPFRQRPWRISSWQTACLTLLVVAGLVAGGSFLGGPSKPSSLPSAAATGGKEVLAGASVAAVSRPVPVSQPGSWPKPEVLHASDLATAEKTLLRRWGIEAGGGEICQTAGSAGLECLKGRGTLRLLQRLNLPAILRLASSNSGLFYATLLELRNNDAVLAMGDRVEVVSWGQLDRFWLGEYTLLWRPPLPNLKNLRFGKNDPGVVWLADALPAIPGATVKPVSDNFDAPLEERVKDYQLRQGLTPDGIAGPLTLILLNQAAGRPGPHLTGSD